jgi:hypothetical protein
MYHDAELHAMKIVFIEVFVLSFAEFRKADPPLISYAMFTFKCLPELLPRVDVSPP